MLEVVHASLQFSLRVDGLFNEVEQFDAAGIDIHIPITPSVDGVVDGILDFLLGLRTMVVRIVAYLYLLDIDYCIIEVLNSEIARCFALSTLSFNHHLGPFTRLQRKLTARRSFNFGAREGDIVRGILVGLCPECRGVFSLRVYIETLNDTNIRSRIDLKDVLIVIFDNRSLTLVNSTVE